MEYGLNDILLEICTEVFAKMKLFNLSVISTKITTPFLSMIVKVKAKRSSIRIAKTYQRHTGKQ